MTAGHAKKSPSRTVAARLVAERQRRAAPARPSAGSPAPDRGSAALHRRAGCVEARPSLRGGVRPSPRPGAGRRAPHPCSLSQSGDPVRQRVLRSVIAQWRRSGGGFRVGRRRPGCGAAGAGWCRRRAAPQSSRRARPSARWRDRSECARRPRSCPPTRSSRASPAAPPIGGQIGPWHALQARQPRGSRFPYAESAIGGGRVSCCRTRDAKNPQMP